MWFMGRVGLSLFVDTLLTKVVTGRCVTRIRSSSNILLQITDSTRELLWNNRVQVLHGAHHLFCYTGVLFMLWPTMQ